MSHSYFHQAVLIRSIGKLPITVGGRTAEHNVKLSEESHFDVVLGRDWVEKMGVKYVFPTAAIDQADTSLQDGSSGPNRFNLYGFRRGYSL